MKRVMIVGAPGSGKSTLARKLGELTGLPVYHMDQIHYQPGWVERNRAEKTLMTQEVHAKERWIFEGGHSATYQERFDRADTLIWLDLPVGLRFFRVFWRTIKQYGKSRPDLPEGCPERFNWETLDFWRFIWRTRQTSRLKILNLLQDVSVEKNILHFTQQHEVDSFIRLETR